MIRISKPIIDSECLDSLDILQKEFGIRRRIRYRTSCLVTDAFTMGIIQPIILVPDRDLEESERRFLYKHELSHIKNGDSFLKAVEFAAICLNWYNPFVYILVRELDCINENICDEAVISFEDKSTRIRYGNLTLQMVTDINSKPFYREAFGSNSKLVEERIRLIMHPFVEDERRKRTEKYFLCLLLIISLFLSIELYHPPTVIKVENISYETSKPEELLSH